LFFPTGIRCLPQKEKQAAGKMKYPAEKIIRRHFKKNEVLPDDCPVETDTYLV
jgi:hypothetical protein